MSRRPLMELENLNGDIFLYSYGILPYMLRFRTVGFYISVGKYTIAFLCVLLKPAFTHIRFDASKYYFRINIGFPRQQKTRKTSPWPIFSTQEGCAAQSRTIIPSRSCEKFYIYRLPPLSTLFPKKHLGRRPPTAENRMFTSNLCCMFFVCEPRTEVALRNMSLPQLVPAKRL